MKRHILHIITFIALIFICFDINAQDNIAFDLSSQGNSTTEKKGFFKWVDNILIGKVRYDTTYMGVPYGKWSISLFENLSRHHYFQITNGDPYQIRNTLASSTGIGISYRGVGIGLSVNFRKLKGETKDNDFYIRLYGNRFGGDLLIFNVGNFYDMKYKENVSSNSNLNGFRINAYYVFNNKKYSYSSAFSYSQIQKKSAGSVVAVMSFYSDNLDLGYDNDYYKQTLEYYYNKLYPQGYNDTLSGFIPNVPTGWKTKYLSLGAGYAYNFVPYKNWLLHISIEPSLLIWNKKVVNYDNVSFSKDPDSEFQISKEGFNVKAPYFFFNFCSNAKAGISYSWEKVYLGAYYVGTMYFINLPGDKMESIFGGKSMTIYHWWNARMTVGYRF